MALRKQTKKETEKQDKERRSALIRLDNELMIEIKVLGARQMRTFNSLVQEALQDLLKKYQTKK